MSAGSVHHVDITVTNLVRSTDFYDRILSLFGFNRLPDCLSAPVWASAHIEIGLQQASQESARPHDRYSPGLHHLAFTAPTRSAVDDVYRELQRLGVAILDPPAEYPEYTPGYYAVFFADPDGVKLEYVFTPVWPA